MDFGVKILKIKSGSESASLRYYVYQLSDIRDNFKFFGPKFAQIWILGSKFPKSKSGFGINTSKIPCEPIFSQNGQLWIFQPKFGEIAQLRALFWFEYCWEWCRELGGGWNELSGGGWRWVHGLVISFFKYIFKLGNSVLYEISICNITKKHSLSLALIHFDIIQERLHK